MKKQKLVLTRTQRLDLLFVENDILDSVLTRFNETWRCMDNTADYIPPKFGNKIDKRIFTYFKRANRKIWWLVWLERKRLLREFANPKTPVEGNVGVTSEAHPHVPQGGYTTS